MDSLRDYVWMEYVMEMTPDKVRTVFGDSRVKTAGLKTGCKLEVTKRVLNRLTSPGTWTRLSIIRVTGPDDQSISQFNRLIESWIPVYSTRKEYPKRASLTLLTKSHDNLEFRKLRILPQESLQPTHVRQKKDDSLLMNSYLTDYRRVCDPEGKSSSQRSSVRNFTAESTDRMKQVTGNKVSESEQKLRESARLSLGKLDKKPRQSRSLDPRRSLPTDSDIHRGLLKDPLPTSRKSTNQRLSQVKKGNLSAVKSSVGENMLEPLPQSRHDAISTFNDTQEFCENPIVPTHQDWKPSMEHQTSSIHKTEVAVNHSPIFQTCVAEMEVYGSSFSTLPIERCPEETTGVASTVEQDCKLRNLAEHLGGVLDEGATVLANRLSEQSCSMPGAEILSAQPSHVTDGEIVDSTFATLPVVQCPEQKKHINPIVEANFGAQNLAEHFNYVLGNEATLLLVNCSTGGRSGKEVEILIEKSHSVPTYVTDVGADSSIVSIPLVITTRKRDENLDHIKETNDKEQNLTGHSECVVNEGSAVLTVNRSEVIMTESPAPPALIPDTEAVDYCESLVLTQHQEQGKTTNTVEAAIRVQGLIEHVDGVLGGEATASSVSGFTKTDQPNTWKHLEMVGISPTPTSLHCDPIHVFSDHIVIAKAPQYGNQSPRDWALEEGITNPLDQNGQSCEKDISYGQFKGGIGSPTSPSDSENKQPGVSHDGPDAVNFTNLSRTDLCRPQSSSFPEQATSPCDLPSPPSESEIFIEASGNGLYLEAKCLPTPPEPNLEEFRKDNAGMEHVANEEGHLGTEDARSFEDAANKSEIMTSYVVNTPDELSFKSLQQSSALPRGLKEPVGDDETKDLPGAFNEIEDYVVEDVTSSYKNRALSTTPPLASLSIKLNSPPALSKQQPWQIMVQTSLGGLRATSVSPAQNSLPSPTSSIPVLSLSPVEPPSSTGSDSREIRSWELKLDRQNRSAVTSPSHYDVLVDISAAKSDGFRYSKSDGPSRNHFNNEMGHESNHNVSTVVSVELDDVATQENAHNATELTNIGQMESPISITLVTELQDEGCGTSSLESFYHVAVTKRDDTLPELTSNLSSTNTVIHSVHGTENVETAALHIALDSECRCGMSLSDLPRERGSHVSPSLLSRYSKMSDPPAESCAVLPMVLISVSQDIGVDVLAIHDLSTKEFLRYTVSLLGYGFHGDILDPSERIRWLGPFRYDVVGAIEWLKLASYKCRIAYVSSISSTPLDTGMCAASNMKAKFLRYVQPDNSAVISTCNINAVLAVNCPVCLKLDSECEDGNLASESPQAKTDALLDKTDDDRHSPLTKGGDESSSPPESCPPFAASSSCQPWHTCSEPPWDDINAANSEIGEFSENIGRSPWRVTTGRFVAVNAFLISCRCSKSPWGPAPSAHLGDGCLDLILVRRCSRYQYLRYLLYLTERRKGKHAGHLRLPFVEAYRVCAFQLQALDRDGVPVASENIAAQGTSVWCVDGEVLRNPNIICW
ncbi:unnamed protein product [Mesocestoides corti]|uniref:Ceramide kinase C-terminal domain-containing protein n=1 Tax=Mesocestoides corti TaxID=53468 RepID=A0A158QUQ5_MESCO|nr:unnamed protein product [Mesocestoides corti]